MIDFFITSTNKNIFDNKWNVIQITDNYYLYYQKANFYKSKNGLTIIIIGDVINDLDIINIVDIAQLLNVIKGNFYSILTNGSKIDIASSAFGLLPIYHTLDFGNISSSVRLIKDMGSNTLTNNKKWIINQLLFNYQFGNETFFLEICLFPPFSYLNFSEGLPKFIKYYDVAGEFVSNPISWKKALPRLTKEFINSVDQYIPDQNSVLSFTSGFDGRSLVSIATAFKKIFTAFSYGKLEYDDVFIPLANSEELQIPYFWLDLNEEYAKTNYYESAKKFILNTDGANGFLYAHVDYLAIKVKEKGDVLISGICGSELFRAAHSSGAVTSKALIDLFRENNLESYRELIVNSETFRYINFDEYANIINQVIVETWNYKIHLTKVLNKNKALYVFMYEEIFRKFFGPWVKSQMLTLNVRTPYLDFQFFKNVIKTELSGVYSEFLTDNPLKRFKGQVFYAEIIRMTNKTLFWTKTGKGYAPAVVNNFFLRPYLFIPFFKKRLSRKIKKNDFNNLGIISGIKYSKDEICRLSSNVFEYEKLFMDTINLKSTDKESYRDTILMSYCILLYQKELLSE